MFHVKHNINAKRAGTKPAPSALDVGVKEKDMVIGGTQF
jgi:hypothetical protein